jgi:ABC-2 type transport system ATP-binding protein
VIEVQHLTKDYGTTVAVRDLSFSVEKGEIVGFLGPNGAGKSTTLRILAGFLGATSGEVRVAGFDVGKESLAARRALG